MESVESITNELFPAISLTSDLNKLSLSSNGVTA
jgi:hypothetical protein